MKTLMPSQITEADRPFLVSRGNADGSVTLYYSGDEIPVRDVPVNKTITLAPRQFRQALTKTGLRDAVEYAIAAADQATKDWYEFATEFESTHPVLLQMAGLLGKTSADIDTLFALGATL